MTRILAIDPGYERSAYVLYGGGEPVYSHTVANEEFVNILDIHVFGDADVLLLEQIDSYGMPVGREVFETVFWTGRFYEAAAPLFPTRCRLTRRAVKLQICGSARANDANVRQALIDRYGGSRAEAIGIKKQPGPLYGVHGDQWAALALAVAWAEGAR